MEEGQRFSLQYLERSTPAKDSQRFRNRLAAYYMANLDEYYCGKIISIIKSETGAEIPSSGMGYSVNSFFKENEIRDVLDSISLIYQVVDFLLKEPWKLFVTRVLSEENLGYKLDSKCGVHYFVDEEFERNRFSTLSVLEDTRYNASKAAYEDAYRHMDNDPMDTKAAVRSMFESIEILVKLLVPTERLNRQVVDNALKAKLLLFYKEDETASRVVVGLLDGLADWVNALHNYRHGQDSNEPVEPPEEVAIYVLSSGSSFLRWLVGINNNLNE